MMTLSSLYPSIKTISPTYQSHIRCANYRMGIIDSPCLWKIPLEENGGNYKTVTSGYLVTVLKFLLFSSRGVVLFRKINWSISYKNPAVKTTRRFLINPLISLFHWETTHFISIFMLISLAKEKGQAYANKNPGCRDLWGGGKGAYLGHVTQQAIISIAKWMPVKSIHDFFFNSQKSLVFSGVPRVNYYKMKNGELSSFLSYDLKC